jgi:hypothetical protein
MGVPLCPRISHPQGRAIRSNLFKQPAAQRKKGFPLLSLTRFLVDMLIELIELIQ